MIETKKIDNSFTIKENKTDNPKIKNEDLTKKDVLYKNNIKNVPTKTVNKPEPKSNKESFGAGYGGAATGGTMFGGGGYIASGISNEICPLPFPWNEQCFNFSPPTFDSFMESVGLGTLTDELKEFWNNQIKPGLEEAKGVFDDLWAEIEQIWGRLDPIKNFLSLVKLFISPIIQVLIHILEIVIYALQPLLNSYFGGAATLYFLYYYLFPALFLISAILSMANALMGIINQIRGVEL
tara:strand:+ start:272 stop:985 length:714 start_codon:yes stop_codon:yes gene_type:complete